MLGKMCRTLQTRVPEHLAAIRDALHDQDAPRLREAAHKFCGILSAFSTTAGDQAASLEDLAARGMLNEAIYAVAQLDKRAIELARLAGGLTIDTLRKHAEPTIATSPGRKKGSGDQESLCAVQRRMSSVGVIPTRQLSLQPVAIGATMEVTKSSKPSMQSAAWRCRE
jgi:HPt (histidine-containing phosphotransfer) domain-containing protein